MAFIKSVRSVGKGDVLINLDHVREVRPVSSKDRRTRVTFAPYAGGEAETLTIEADYDHIAADYGFFEGTVLPSP